MPPPADHEGANDVGPPKPVWRGKLVKLGAAAKLGPLEFGAKLGEEPPEKPGDANAPAKLGIREGAPPRPPKLGALWKRGLRGAPVAPPTANGALERGALANDTPEKDGAPKPDAPGNDVGNEKDAGLGPPMDRGAENEGLAAAIEKAGMDGRALETALP
jgi:hypothetical protein